MGLIGVDIADKQVTSGIRERQRLEDLVLSAAKIGHGVKAVMRVVEGLAHAIARGAGEFVFIHAPVCLGRHLMKDIACQGIGVGATVAVAHGGLTVIECRGRKRGPASLESLVEHVDRIGHRDEHELVAAYAVDMLIGMAVQFKVVGDRGDVAIARRVTKVVIADLKAVDVDVGDGVLELAVPDTGDVMVVAGAVGQARERVDVGIDFELFNAVAEAGSGVGRLCEQALGLGLLWVTDVVSWSSASSGRGAASCASFVSMPPPCCFVEFICQLLFVDESY